MVSTQIFQELKDGAEFLIQIMFMETEAFGRCTALIPWEPAKFSGATLDFCKRLWFEEAHVDILIHINTKQLNRGLRALGQESKLI